MKQNMTNTQGLGAGVLLHHGTYRIEAVLGQGGFGITYLATDMNLGRRVAVKEFFPKNYCDRDGSTSHVTLGTQGSKEFVDRLKAKFLKEARNIAKFDHPGIIKIHAAFEENNTAYYVMDYIEGRSLSEVVREDGPLSEEKALDYIRKVGAALEYIHAGRINHLDVKPANIMVRGSDDAPVLIDFGLSKQYDSSGNQTSTTPVGISHGYAPMEQYDDGGVKEFSPATDIYSLAATLYFLLSGVVPPPATKLVEDELTFPATIPPRLVGPIAKAMSAGRKRRYQDIPSFLNSLTADAAETVIDAPVDESTSIHVPERKVASSAPLSSKPVPKPVPAKPWFKRPRVLVPAFIVLLVLLLVVFVSTGGFFTGEKSRDEITAEVAEADGSINGHDYVDLGLSVKWATCNVGASSPFDPGDYFAWGEISIDPGENYKIDDTQGDIAGNPFYDAARANWGGSWRMPTKAELEELKDRCTWTWTKEENGDNGYLVKGPNGKSIFVLAAGGHYGAHTGSFGVPDSFGVYGCFWSSTPDGLGPYRLLFNRGHLIGRYDSRFYRLSVRPVSE